MHKSCVGRGLAVLCGSFASLAFAALADVRSGLVGTSIPFIPNAGQWDERAAFAAPMFAGTLFVTTDGQLVYRLAGKREHSAEPVARQRRPARGPDWVLSETFVDERSEPILGRPHGVALQAGRVRYAIGNHSPHQRDPVDTFGRVELGEVFPSIDVALRATGGNVEKIFTVAPGGNAKRIRVRVEGVTSLAIDASGSLVAMTGNGPVVYTAPIAYQVHGDGRRTDVRVAYALHGETNTYGFEVGDFDPGKPLVIDPLLQSTYAGGSAEADDVLNIAIHPLTGDVYIVGTTSSLDYPSTAGGAQQSNTNVDFVAFVSRFNAALTTRYQSTYFGGTAGATQAWSIGFHPHNGDVYVAGWTTDGGLPGTIGGAQPSKAGGYDAFVVRFDPSLTTRIQATYFGGTADDYGWALAVHPVSGEVYLAGESWSDDLPRRTGGAQATYNGNRDGYVVRLNSELTEFRQSTYFGGSLFDKIYGLTINGALGEIVAAGSTISADLPNRANGAQADLAGGWDAFVTRFNYQLTANLQSTYLGGSGYDDGYAVVALANGDVAVAIPSASPSIAGMPGTLAGENDAVLALLTPQLTAIKGGSRIDGGGTDVPFAVAQHPAGDLFVTGYTSSPAPFPGSQDAAQATHGGNLDGFIARFDASANLVQTTYFGGGGDDAANAIAIHPVTGHIYTAGYTYSTALPGVLADSAQGTRAGPADGFVARLTFDLRNAAVSQPAPFSFGSILNAPPGSLQTSAPATISGLGAPQQPVAVMGGHQSQFCISSTASCSCNVRAFASSPAKIDNGQSVCIRQRALLETPASSTARLLVGAGAATFLVGTGGCSLDIDGNGVQDALTDGLMLVRALFGLTGTSVTNGTIGGGATRTTWAQIRPYLNGNCGTNFAQ